MVDSPRLFLITPPVADAPAFAPDLEAALAGANVACVLIRAAARDEPAIKSVVRLLAPIAQRHGAAALVEQEARFAARLDVDGVHLAGGSEAFEEALAALKPHKIVGAGGLFGRDAAMAAGEAGADYLMFGGPGGRETHDAIRERIAWWAEIFNVPCVGYAGNPDLAGDIARAGAEFIGLCDGLWETPATIATTIAAVTRAIAPVSEVIP